MSGKKETETKTKAKVKTEPETEPETKAKGKTEAKGVEIAKRSREETKPAEGKNPNADICKLLLELADYEEFSADAKTSRYRKAAYRKAAQILSEHSTRIKSGKEAESLPGIGPKIGEKIDEFLETGSIKKVEEARHDDDAKILAELSRVPGIGPATAKKFIEQGIKSIENLRENQDQLNDAQKIGLKYLEEIEKPIPRNQVKKSGHFMEEEFKKLHKDLEVTLCGAYRRGDETITEIVAVVTHKSRIPDKSLMDELVQVLQKNHFLTEILSQGEHQLRAVVSFGEGKGRKRSRSKSPSKISPKSKKTSVQAIEEKPKVESRSGNEHHSSFGNHLLSLHLYPERQYYTAIWRWTGNDLFVQEMQSKAKAKGFLLNEFGLHRNRDEKNEGEKDDEVVKVTKEEDIFEALDMDYVEPEDRNVA